jgi:hypothetical protein
MMMEIVGGSIFANTSFAYCEEECTVAAKTTRLKVKLAAEQTTIQAVRT